MGVTHSYPFSSGSLALGGCRTPISKVLGYGLLTQLSTISGAFGQTTVSCTGSIGVDYYVSDWNQLCSGKKMQSPSSSLETSAYLQFPDTICAHPNNRPNQPLGPISGRG